MLSLLINLIYGLGKRLVGLFGIGILCSYWALASDAPSQSSTKANIDLAALFAQTQRDLEQEKIEASANNSKLTNDDLMQWYAASIAYDPETFTAWQAKNDEQKIQALTELRDQYSQLGMQITPLQAMTAKERLEFDWRARWQAAGAIRLRKARDQISKLTKAQLQIVLDSCKTLMKDVETRRGYNVKTPSELEFLNPDLVRAYPDSCQIYLQKGIGRAYGLSVEFKNGAPMDVLLIDDYKGWQREKLQIK